MGTRFLYLVRHGQFHREESSANYGSLTALGRRQAKRIGKRLACIELAVMHHSDMPRAVETAEIIAGELRRRTPTQASKLLREGVPTAPIPWLPDFTRKEAREHRARMDAAFVRYFKPARGAARHELLVAHGNIIRYFVRRALGDPIAKWLDMSVLQASLTVIAIEPTYRTMLMGFNDVGHLPPKMCTFL